MEVKIVSTSSGSSGTRTSTKITELFLRLIFIPFGIFAESRYKQYERPYTVAFVFAFATLFAGQVKCYESLNSLLYVLDNSMYVIATLVATIFLLTARRDEHIFEQFYANVISYEFAGDEFFNETDARLKKLAVTLGVVIAAGFTGVIVYPIMNASFTDVGLGSPSTLIYLSFYPWQIDTVPKYAATIVLQLCSGSVVCMVVGGMIFFMIYCIVVLEAHRNVLTRKISKINEKVRFLDANVDANFYRDIGRANAAIQFEINENVVEELKQVVKYHHFVNRFTNNVTACCSRIVDTSTAAVFSCIIILMTIFLMGSGDYMYQLKIVSMSLVTFCLFCIECYIGEILNHMNSEILLQAYNLKWYRRSLSFRKLMLLVMTRCQQPFQIKAFNTLNVNFLFFTMLLKNTYSVLQFILRMQKDRHNM